jgi:hypothetical protein
VYLEFCPDTNFLRMHQYVHVDSGRAITLHVGVCEAVDDLRKPVNTGLKILVGSKAILA